MFDVTDRTDLAQWNGRDFSVGCRPSNRTERCFPGMRSEKVLFTVSTTVQCIEPPRPSRSLVGCVPRRKFRSDDLASTQFEELLPILTNTCEGHIDRTLRLMCRSRYMQWDSSMRSAGKMIIRAFTVR